MKHQLTNRFLALVMSAAMVAGSVLPAYATDAESVAPVTEVTAAQAENGNTDTALDSSVSAEETEPKETADPAEDGVQADPPSDKEQAAGDDQTDESAELTEKETADPEIKKDDAVSSEDRESESSEEETDNPKESLSYASNNDGTHVVTRMEAGEDFESSTEDCDFEEDGRCKYCGYMEESEQEEEEPELVQEHFFVYEIIDDESHSKMCADADLTDEEGKVICDFEPVIEKHELDETGKCICGYEVHQRIFYDQTFELSCNGIDILVTGDLPAGVEVNVKEVSTDSVQSEADEMGLGMTILRSFDITLLLDGQEYEPSDDGKRIIVRFTNLLDEIKSGDEVSILHTDDNGSTAVVNDVVEIGENGDSIAIEVSDFSVYSIATMTVEGTYDIPLVGKHGTVYHMYLTFQGVTKEAFCLDLGKSAHSNDTFSLDGVYTENNDVRNVVQMYESLDSSNPNRPTYAETQVLIWGFLEGYSTQADIIALLDSVGESGRTDEQKEIIATFLGFDSTLKQNYAVLGTTYVWTNTLGGVSDGYQRFVTALGSTATEPDVTENYIKIKFFYNQKAFPGQNVYLYNHSSGTNIYPDAYDDNGVYYFKYEDLQTVGEYEEFHFIWGGVSHALDAYPYTDETYLNSSDISSIGGDNPIIPYLWHGSEIMGITCYSVDQVPDIYWVASVCDINLYSHDGSELIYTHPDSSVGLLSAVARSSVLNSSALNRALEGGIAKEPNSSVVFIGEDEQFRYNFSTQFSLSDSAKVYNKSFATVDEFYGTIAPILKLYLITDPDETEDSDRDTYVKIFRDGIATDEFVYTNIVLNNGSKTKNLMEPVSGQAGLYKFHDFILGSGASHTVTIKGVEYPWYGIYTSSAAFYDATVIGMSDIRGSIYDNVTNDISSKYLYVAAKDGYDGDQYVVVNIPSVSYSVSFVDEDGSTSLSTPKTDYELGDTITNEPASEPTKAAVGSTTYVFDKWVLVSDETKKYSFGNVPVVTGNAVYKASYTSTEHYSVSFVDEDGITSLSTPKTDYELGDAVTNEPVSKPTKTPADTVTYEFDKWVLVSDNNRKYEFGSIPAVSGNAVYKASYIATEHYTVAFVDEDGTTSLSEPKTDYESGDSVTNEPTTKPTKAQDDTYTYEFSKWISSADSSEYEYNGSFPAVTQSVTYRASYAPTYRTYTVRFVDHDDAHISTHDYHYGDTITVPADPTRPNEGENVYAFSGWTPMVSSTCVGDATYKATYTTGTRTYTVRFVDSDGATVLGTIKSDYSYNDTVTNEPAQPSKAADETYTYSFAGWLSSVDENNYEYGTIPNVTSDVTYKATYTPAYINYTVTFIDNDWNRRTGSGVFLEKIISSETYHYGDTIVIPDDPAGTRTFTTVYTFAGWTPVVSPTCTGNATYKAAYNEETRKYTVVFVAPNGNPDDPDYGKFQTYGTIRTDYEYGDDIIYPTTDPEYLAPTGRQDFNGWHLQYAAYYKNYLNTGEFARRILTTAPTKTYEKVEEKYESYDVSVDCIYNSVFAFVAGFTTDRYQYVIRWINDDNVTIIQESTGYFEGTPSEIIDESDPDSTTFTTTKTDTASYNYMFTGWDKSDTMRAAWRRWMAAGSDTSQPIVIRYYAQYDRTTVAPPAPTYYTVKFVDDDGTVISIRTYTYGQTITIPADPDKDDTDYYRYDFEGWMPSVNPTCRGDATYTATYDKTPILYGIEFRSETGSTLGTIKNDYQYKDSVTNEPVKPTKSEDDTYKYNFKGWKSSLNGVIYSYGSIPKVTADTVYIAVFDKVKKSKTTPVQPEDSKPTDPEPSNPETPAPSDPKTPTPGDPITPEDPNVPTTPVVPVKPSVTPPATPDPVRPITPPADEKESENPAKPIPYPGPVISVVPSEPTVTPEPQKDDPSPTITETIEEPEEELTVDPFWKRPVVKRVARAVLATLVTGAVGITLGVTGAFNYIYMLLLCLLFKRRKIKFHGILTDDENKFIEFRGKTENDKLVQQIIDENPEFSTMISSIIGTEQWTVLPPNTKMDVSYFDDGEVVTHTYDANEDELFKDLEKLIGKDVTVNIYCTKANIEIELKYKL